ncbi:elongation factor Tu [Pseudomonas putida]|nr:elongation factor Tu [Pseudomonas putida]
MQIALMLGGIQRHEVERGQVLSQPGAITAHTRFEAQFYLVSHAEGGRLSPVFNGWKAQVYFRSADVTGVFELEPGVDMLLPGDHATMIITLVATIAMEPGLRFAVREGGRTVGFGVVAKIQA